MARLSCVLLVVVALSMAASNGQAPINGSITNADNTWILEWVVENATGIIELQISAKAQGWVAVGFSNEPKGHDLTDSILAWSTANLTAYAYDQQSSKQHVQPNLDTNINATNDVGVIFGFESNGWTVVRVARRLDTWDAKADLVITNRDLWVMWAYGAADPIIDARGDIRYEKHIASGPLKVNLDSMTGAAAGGIGDGGGGGAGSGGNGIAATNGAMGRINQGWYLTLLSGIALYLAIV